VLPVKVLKLLWFIFLTLKPYRISLTDLLEVGESCHQLRKNPFSHWRNLMITEEIAFFFNSLLYFCNVM